MYKYTVHGELLDVFTARIHTLCALVEYYALCTCTCTMHHAPCTLPWISTYLYNVLTKALEEHYRNGANSGGGGYQDRGRTFHYTQVAEHLSALEEPITWAKIRALRDARQPPYACSLQPYACLLQPYACYQQP